MTVSRGRVHKSLGMTLDYTICGQVKISMFNYVNEIINAFDKAEPKEGGPNDLFKVDKDREQLRPKQKGCRV
jgi:hypothetical protein